MKITYDPDKRNKTLKDRGLDFEQAPSVFNGVIFEIEDIRKDYGECRIMCFGLLNDRMVVIGYVERETARHIFSMRHANEKERKRFKNKLV